MDVFRGSKDEQINQVLSVIRSNASLSDVGACIRDQQLDARKEQREGSPQLEILSHHIDELQHEQSTEPEPGVLGKTSFRRCVLDIAHLTDEPPYAMTASPWTTVTDDDVLCSNLLSLWITWNRQWCNWLALDLLLSDLHSGNLQSTYCSPFLVNTILALGCPHSDYPEARSRRGVQSDLLDSFVDEAKRLLAEVEMVPSITTAQGLANMYVVMGSNGEDDVAWSYLQRALAMCKDLEKQGRARTDSIYTEALSTTCWGLWNFSSLACTILQKSPECAPPKIQRPPPVPDSEDWYHYPRQADSRPSYIQTIMHHVCELAMIIHEVDMVQIFGDQQSIGGNFTVKPTVISLRTRLAEWHDKLPSYLLPSHAVAPAVLMEEYSFIRLQDGFANIYRCWYNAVIMTMHAHITRKQAMLDTKALEEFTEYAQAAALDVVRIVRIWQTEFGTSNTHVALLPAIYHALVVLLSCRKTNDSTLYESEILDMCIQFRSIGRPWTFAMGAFRMFQVTILNQGKSLPFAAQKLFEDFETREWQN